MCDFSGLNPSTDIGSFNFGLPRGSTPDIPPPPAAAAAAITRDSPEVVAARLKARQAAARRGGRAATLLVTDDEEHLGSVSRPGARSAKVLGAVA